MEYEELAKLLFKTTMETAGVPFDEDKYEREKTKAFIESLLEIERNQFSRIEVTLMEYDNESPDDACGFYEIDTLYYYDNDGLLMQDTLHSKVFNFTSNQFGNGYEPIPYIAKSMKVDKDIIEIV